jgi:hypothetical protein
MHEVVAVLMGDRVVVVEVDELVFVLLVSVVVVNDSGRYSPLSSSAPGKA